MILLLDNYDSFTYNLYQFIAGVESEISGIQKDQTNSEVKVVRNDQITPEEILELAPEALVISPGGRANLLMPESVSKQFRS